MENNEEAERLRVELKIEEKLASEREANHNRFAMKLVEKIVFGLVSIILISVCSALVALLLK